MNRLSSVLCAVALAPASFACAQVLAPEFAGSYTVRSLGSPPGVTSPLAGMTIKLSVPNTLAIGGSGNSPGGTVYGVALARDPQGHIVGWGCVPTEIITAAPNIDGGLCYGPAGVLFYTAYPINVLGQVVPGDTAPTRTIDLTALGVASSVGGVLFVPAGFPGAGELKLLCYSAGGWYSTTVTPDGAGTFNVAPVSAPIPIGGGPEGAVYVHAGNPQFTHDSILVAQYSLGQVMAFEVDANGDPVIGTGRPFITGLSGAEGAMVDPLTGDFLFGTFGGLGQVIAVSGFTQSQTCIGDLNNDGHVDGADLGLLLAHWGDCPHCPSDLNGDCIVNGADIGVLLSAWGPCPH